MSRIGKVPVEIPSGVEVSINGNIVTVKGPKGTLDKEFSPLAEVEIADNQVVIKPSNNSRSANAIYGTTRSIVANMVQGVTKPFSKNLLIEGVGFRATVKGSMIDLELGFHQRLLKY